MEVDAIYAVLNKKIRGIESGAGGEGGGTHTGGILDTRGESHPPSWYIENYLCNQVTELRKASDVGFSGTDNIIVDTVVTEPVSGKCVVQRIYYIGNTYHRYNTDHATWSQPYINVDASRYSFGIQSGYVRTGKKSYDTTEGQYSTMEGDDTTASGKASHAEGSGTKALGSSAHAEGVETEAGAAGTHTEGGTTRASGIWSHAEGHRTHASGDSSHAEGTYTLAWGQYSHAGGYYTYADTNQFVAGHYNKKSGGSYSGSGAYTAFAIGNGTGTEDAKRSNAFRVQFDGRVYSNGAYAATGADYAEYFEWQDGNPDREDRRGYFVTLDGEKIRKASAEDAYILGVVSANPVIIGNADPDWQGRFLKDEFGAFLTRITEVEENEPEPVTETVTKTDEEGKEYTETIEKVVDHIVKKEVIYYVPNPDYDSAQSYQSRAERPEWSLIGMLGVLHTRDDGTCQVNGYCRCTDGGIATASESGYRVLARVNDHVIKILVK